MDTSSKTAYSFPKKQILLLEEELSYISSSVNKDCSIILKKILENANNIPDILAGVRHEFYVSGISGEADEVFDNSKEELSNFTERHNINVENNTKEYYDVLRTIRTSMAIRVFSEMSEEKSNMHLSRLYTKYMGIDNNLFFDEYFSSKEGGLVKIINKDTPIRDLISIIAASEKEENRENKTLQSIKRDASEFLIRELITKNPSLMDKLIKYLTSENYLNIVKQMPDTLSDGAIGGKAGGVILGYAALRKESPEFDNNFAAIKGLSLDELKEKVNLDKSLIENKSTFIGSDIFRKFVAHNPGLARTAELKSYYSRGSRTPEEDKEVKELHSHINKAFDEAEFPAILKRQLKVLFRKMYKKGQPIIVRSSSELEDMLGAAFAGKYDSIHLANSGDKKEDFKKFLDAIKIVYKSVFSVEVLEYRRKKKLLNYDEEMGLLIQDINGENFEDKYFFPDFSAVGLSYATQSFGSDVSRGAMSIAAGLGDQVVDNEGKFIMLDTPKATGVTDNFVQNEIIVMDLEKDEKVSIDSGVFLKDMRKNTRFLAYAGDKGSSSEKINLKYLATATDVPLIIEYIIQKLKYQLGYNVDCEFTIQHKGMGEFAVNLVQQRPQYIPLNLTPSKMPENIKTEDILLDVPESMTSGHISDIKYAIYIDPSIFQDPAYSSQSGVGASIKDWVNILNRELDDKYIILSPRRWGSHEIGPHGLPAKFSDFFNAAGFVEMFDVEHNPSLGTHAFQDIMDASMITGSVDTQKFPINEELIDKYPNVIQKILKSHKVPEDILKYLKLVDFGESRLNLAANNIPVGNEKPRLSIYISEKDQNKPITLKLDN